MSTPLLVKVSRDGKEIGTYEAKEAVRLLVYGTLKETDHYWHEGMIDWAPLSKLQEAEGRRQKAEAELKANLNMLNWILEEFKALFNKLPFKGSTIAARIYFYTSLLSLCLFVFQLRRPKLEKALGAIVLCLFLFLAVQTLYLFLSGWFTDDPIRPKALVNQNDRMIITRSRKIFVLSAICILITGWIFG